MSRRKDLSYYPAGIINGNNSGNIPVRAGPRGPRVPSPGMGLADANGPRSTHKQQAQRRCRNQRTGGKKERRKSRRKKKSQKGKPQRLGFLLVRTYSRLDPGERPTQAKAGAIGIPTEHKNLHASLGQVKHLPLLMSNTFSKASILSVIPHQAQPGLKSWVQPHAYRRPMGNGRVRRSANDCRAPRDEAS